MNSETLNHMMDANTNLKTVDKKSRGSYKEFLTRKEIYRPLFLITFLTVIQQFSGMTIIRSYVVKLFKNLSMYLFVLVHE